MSFFFSFPLPNNKTVILGSWDHSICAYDIEYGKVHQFNGAHRSAHGIYINCKMLPERMFLELYKTEFQSFACPQKTLAI